ncbi:hypothetical protein CPC16_010505 [Podila verticillata]|nr:hypothetical protein CPC16_010505 [Podila verticillata]
MNGKLAAVNKTKRGPMPEPESQHKKPKPSTETSTTATTTDAHFIQPALDQLSSSRQQLKGAYKALGQVSVRTLPHAPEEAAYTIESELEAIKHQLRRGLVNMKRSQLTLEESCILSRAVKREQNDECPSCSGSRNIVARVEVRDGDSTGGILGEQDFDALIESELEACLVRVRDMRAARRHSTTITTTTTTTTGRERVAPAVPVVVTNDTEAELNDLRMLRDALARGDELEHELEVAQRELIEARVERQQEADRHAGEVLELQEEIDRLEEEADRHAGEVLEQRGELEQVRGQAREIAVEMREALATLNWAKNRLEDVEYALDDKEEISAAELDDAHWTLRDARETLGKTLKVLEGAQDHLDQF